VFGGGSFQIARVFGIRIGVDASWFLVLLLIVWSLSDYYLGIFPGEQTKSYILAVVSGLLFFLSILLHELGHAVVAMRNGIGIIGIDLWMLGGVAKLERDTDSPGVEFRVAAAGPMVTLLIVAACFGAATAIGGTSAALDAGEFDLSSGKEVLAVLGYLTFINALLLAFNLIPAFPLDGGRIARSIAWKITGDGSRATRIAARLGRAFSLLMVGIGVFLIVRGTLINGVWLIFMGIFLGQAARSAEVQSEITGRIEGLRVADVMERPLSIRSDLTLDRATEEYLRRNDHLWYPVVDPDGRLTGLVTREAVEGVAEAARPSRTVAAVMAADRENDGSGFRVGADEPFESLLGLEGFARLGAIMAVDTEGRLRGIVTVEGVNRALQAPRAAREGIA
jgi:Zn-dependent protease